MILFVACLVAALAGQYYFARRRDLFWDGVILYAVAAFCFARLFSRRAAVDTPETPSPWKQAGGAAEGHTWRRRLLLPGLLALVSAILWVAAQRDGLAVLCWLLGVVLCLRAWSGQRWNLAGPPEEEAPGEGTVAPPQAEAGPRPAERWEFVVVAGCTLVALALRLPRLGTIPFLLSGDEASMGLEAVRILKGDLGNPFGTGWLSHPNLYFFLMAGPIRLLGRTIWAVRLLSPLAGSATIPVFYLLARRVFDRRVALVGTVMLTVSHLHIHFSRLGINNVYDPLFAVLAFFFLVRGLQEGRTIDFTLSGLCAGLGQYFYMGARLIPIVLLAYGVAWSWTRRVSWRRLWAPAASLVSAFLAASGPLLYTFVRQPQDFMARLTTVGIIQSRWLWTEQEITGKTALQLLWDQFRKSFLAFNYTVDPTSWYAAPIPYLDFLSSVFFVLGLVVLLRRARGRGYLLVSVWFWLALLFGGVLIENPPSSPRFVIFMPAVCLITAAGLVHVLDLGAALAGLSRAWVVRAVAVLLVAILVLNVGFYFFRYTPSGVFGGLNTEVGTRLGEYLHEHGAGYMVYFFGPTRMWLGYATIPFLAPEMTGINVEEPLEAPPMFVFPNIDAMFVFLPERLGELNWVVPVCPQGSLQEVHGHTGELLFSVYEVRWPGSTP